MLVISNNCANLLGGYGSATLNMLRQLYGTMHRESEFPLTLGRDFSGHIVDMGCGVDQNIYRIGDAVSCAKLIFSLTHWICVVYTHKVGHVIFCLYEWMLFLSLTITWTIVLPTLTLCVCNYPSNGQKIIFTREICVHWWELSWWMWCGLV